MSNTWIIIIGILLTAGFIWSVLFQKKRIKQGWDELADVRNTILTATTKQQLEDAIEVLNIIQKSSQNEYLVGACIGLRMFINDKIKFDYPLSQ